ncbi:hypothetical protein HDU93_002530 [Gonapodya sp. JEL0774]|nr:hypothetical protein HDU93_002530 [Gonapodya sp. JEL0774]
MSHQITPHPPTPHATLLPYQLPQDKFDEVVSSTLPEDVRLHWELPKGNEQNSLILRPFGSAREVVKGGGVEMQWGEGDKWIDISRRLMMTIRVSIEFFHFFLDGYLLQPGMHVGSTVVKGDVVDIVPALEGDVRAYFEKMGSKARMVEVEPDSTPLSTATRLYHLLPPPSPSASPSLSWHTYLSNRTNLTSHFNLTNPPSLTTPPLLPTLHTYHLRKIVSTLDLTLEESMALVSTVVPILSVHKSTPSVGPTRPWSVETLVRVYSPFAALGARTEMASSPGGSVDLWFGWRHRPRMRDVEYATVMGYKINIAEDEEDHVRRAGSGESQADGVGGTPSSTLPPYLASDLKQLRASFTRGEAELTKLPSGWKHVFWGYFDNDPGKQVNGQPWKAVEKRDWIMGKGQLVELRRVLFGVDRVAVSLGPSPSPSSMDQVTSPSRPSATVTTDFTSIAPSDSTSSPTTASTTTGATSSSQTSSESLPSSTTPLTSRIPDLVFMDLLLSSVGVFAFRAEARLDISVGMTVNVVGEGDEGGDKGKEKGTKSAVENGNAVEGYGENNTWVAGCVRRMVG